MKMVIEHLAGNEELLKLPKTAFLCSRKVPAGIVLKCYDWAVQQRDAGNCVISGFHNQIEKDVLHFLLKGNQSIIIVLARSFKKQMDSDLVKPFEEDRLLIISPFGPEVKRASVKTAEIRNQVVAKLADIITIGYCRPGGQLTKMINLFPGKIIYFQ